MFYNFCLLYVLNIMIYCYYHIVKENVYFGLEDDNE